MESRPPLINQLSAISARLAITLWISAVFTACCHKELEMPTPVEVTVAFDWSNAPDAEVDGMSVYFFPADAASQLWRFDIAGRQGGKIEIPAGNYRVIAVNNDLPGVTFTNTNDYAGFSAAARPLSGDSICRSTGMLYGATIPQVDISFKNLRYNGTARPIVSDKLTISLEPDSMSTVYNITVDSISRPERIRSARALLYGVAASTLVATATNSSATCTVEAPLGLKDGRSDSGALVGSATAFGTPTVTSPTFSVKVLIQTPYATYSKKFDVTDQLENHLTDKNVTIHISGFDLPASDPGSSPGTGVEIGVGVDGWQVIEINYDTSGITH